jgi:prolipoprotein diacylglyceryl transferase
MSLLSINWDPSPILFQIGPIAIRYYSLMFVIAFLLGIFIEKKLYKNDGVSVELVDSIFIYTVVATLLGARLGDVFFYSWDYYKNHLLEILLPVKFDPFRFTGFRGLASHGAAIGIIIAMFLFKKYKLPQKSILWILDRVVIPVAIGGAFVRIGNLMNSEIVGKYTGTDYGFIFLRHQDEHGVLDTLPRHPTQIYEALSYVVVFAVLWFIYWKTDKRKKEGYLFGIFMVLLWSVRFIIEFFKIAQLEEREVWSLNTGQLLSIPMILVGLYFVFREKVVKPD